MAGDDEAIRYFIESREPRFGCTMDELAAQATPDKTRELVASCQAVYDLFASSSGPFLDGDSPTYTDCCAASLLIWFGKINADGLLKPILDGDRTGSLRRLHDAALALL